MKRLLKKLGRWLLRMSLWFLGITFCWVLLGRWVNPSLTYLMVERYFECEEDCFINKQWKDYEYISENMALAVIAAEDQNFFEHQGFDMESIGRAIKDKRKGKRLRGASTISQQVAKNVFLWHGRNWLRKGLEVYFTFMVETLWSKKRIIEVYLNVTELGDGVYGAEAAAQKYFKKPAMKLTSREAALIATVLPNPRKMKLSSPSGYMYKRQRWILGQMNNLGGTAFLHPDEESGQ